MNKEPIVGSHYLPYLETDMRDFGLYPWWAFCVLSQRFIIKTQNNFMEEIKNKKFKLWDWIVIICSILLIIAGLLMIRKIEGIGLILWGLLAGYKRFKIVYENKFK